ncbi:hypothetical protein [Clostridium perfringens]|uniref:Uncharacterized protein n=1 Tax=Clostridium perfringens TaxID=1502 RepID=A0A140GS92_CLOPF|nr:hypothetical protein [Clostridium perfringens]AMN31401.1 hypothetical protein JFP838_pA0485 [Clostridium perfringens]
MKKVICGREDNNKFYVQIVDDEDNYICYGNNYNKDIALSLSKNLSNIFNIKEIIIF